MTFDEIFYQIFSDCKMDEKTEEIVKTKCRYIFDKGSCSGFENALDIITNFLNSEIPSKGFEEWKENEIVLKDFIEFINVQIDSIDEVNSTVEDIIEEEYELTLDYLMGSRTSIKQKLN